MKNLKEYLYKVYGAETPKELRVAFTVHLVVASVVSNVLILIFRALGWL